MGYTDLGNKEGRIYAVRGGNIFHEELNTPEGLRLMKALGLKSRALALGQRGTFKIKVSEITDAGTISAITVNAVDQISGTINYDVGQEVSVANEIAEKIVSHTAATGQNYTAVNVGDIVVGYAPIGAPTSINGYSVGASNTGNIAFEIEDVSGVPDQTQIYSTTHGYQFFVDSSATAPSGDYSAAEEVTKFIVPQTLDGALPSKTVELAGDIATAERVGAISFLKLESQSGGSDTCIGINPQGYADNDLVYACAVDSDTTITFEESENGNLLLKDSEAFISTSDVGEYILFRHIGGTFIELMRSGGAAAGGMIEMTYGQGLAAMQAGTLVPGTLYKITDRGHRGLILTAITNKKFSLEGQFIAAVPDYQNTTGNFIGDWHSGLTPSVGQITTYADGTQYINTTGTNTSTNPAADTTNWDALDRATNINYIVEIHDVEFDYTNDLVVSRADSRGNYVRYGLEARSEMSFSFSPLLGIDTIDNFWWGNNNISGNTCINGYIERNFFYVTGEIRDNYIEGMRVTSSLDSQVVNIRGCRWIGGDINSKEPALRFVINEAGSLNLSAVDIKLLSGNSTGIAFHGAYSITNSTFILSGAQTLIRDNITGVYLELLSITGISGTSNLYSSMNNKSVSGYRSTGEISIDITESTNLSFNSRLDGTMILESSNSEETISSFTGPNRQIGTIRLKADAGLSLTVLGSDATSPAAGEIIIPPAFWDEDSPSDSGFAGQLTLDGDRGDYCEIRMVPITTTTFYAIVEKVVQL